MYSAKLPVSAPPQRRGHSLDTICYLTCSRSVDYTEFISLSHKIDI